MQILDTKQLLSCALFLSPCLYHQANKKLQEEPGHSVEALQDELIAVKLREAEANLSLKELRHTVNELEDHWQVREPPQFQIGAFIIPTASTGHLFLSSVQ